MWARAFLGIYDLLNIAKSLTTFSFTINHKEKKRMIYCFNLETMFYCTFNTKYDSEHKMSVPTNVFSPFFFATAFKKALKA